MKKFKGVWNKSFGGWTFTNNYLEKVINKLNELYKNIQIDIIEQKTKNKSCKKVSATRCSPHVGEMDNECQLSDKNRCVMIKKKLIKSSSSEKKTEKKISSLSKKNQNSNFKMITWNILANHFVRDEIKDNNVNYQQIINTHQRWDNIIKLILTMNIDLIGLQECSLMFFEYLHNYLIQNKINDYTIFYGGPDYEKLNIQIPENFHIPVSYKSGIKGSHKEWKNRNHKYGNISIINNQKFNNINYYFSPFDTDTNHTNAIILTFDYEGEKILWINLHLSTSYLSKHQINILKYNIDKIQEKEQVEYLLSNRIVISGDFNNQFTNKTKFLDLFYQPGIINNGYNVINSKQYTFCHHKWNIDNVIYHPEYIKLIDMKIGEEYLNFKCCNDPDIKNQGLNVSCIQEENEMSDHKLIYADFNLIQTKTNIKKTIKNKQIIKKNITHNFSEYIEELLNKKDKNIEKGFCVLFIHGSFNPIHNGHINSIIKVKDMIEKQSIHNDCQSKNIIGILAPTSSYLLSHKYSNSTERFTDSQRLEMIKLAIGKYDWLYYTDYSLNKSTQSTFSVREYIHNNLKKVLKKYNIHIPITFLEIFGEDYMPLQEDKRCNNFKIGKLYVERKVKDKQTECKFENYKFKNITSDISSTKIRNALHNVGNTHTNLEYLQLSLPEDVLNYINKNQKKIL